MAGPSARIELHEIAEMIQALGKLKVAQAIRSGVDFGLMAMTRDVIANRMSGQYLGVVTGTARRSIRDRSRRSAEKVIGEFGSPLGYVRAHELGFSGTVQIPAHIRRLVQVRGRSGRVTKRGLRAYKRALREGRKTYAHVKPHSRTLNLRARHFLRDALQGKLPLLGSAIERALLRLAQTGVVPKPGEL